ncbi:MAG: pilus assembly FimT family protein [Candidatus Aminicenantales bacterium]
MPAPADRGFVLIILLMVVFVLTIWLTAALPVWQTQVAREKEEELIFRGLQYVEAIRCFQMKNPGRFPSSMKDLEEGRFLRKPYTDPMSEDGSWNVILNPGSPSGGVPRIMVAAAAELSSIRNPVILGVVSSSPGRSIKLYEKQDRYSRWLFYYGHDPAKQPEIIYYGREENEEEPEAGGEHGGVGE